MSHRCVDVFGDDTGGETAAPAVEEDDFHRLNHNELQREGERLERQGYLSYIDNQAARVKQEGFRLTFDAALTSSHTAMTDALAQFQRAPASK